MSAAWDQSKFDATLKDYLARLGKEKFPRALNKKAFFVALRAMAETEKVNKHRVFWVLRQPGKEINRPIGYLLAARRAKHFYTRTTKTGRKKRNLRQVWQRLVERKFQQMVGARQRACGFIRVGWLAVVRQLGPRISGSKFGAPPPDTTLNAHGTPKGSVVPAKGDQLLVRIENFAHAKSEQRGGFMRIGAPALQRAFDAETASMKEFMEKEALNEETARFNQQQK